MIRVGPSPGKGRGIFAERKILRHETIEMASDPFPFSNPGYVAPEPLTETADLCVFKYVRELIPSTHGWPAEITLTRSYSQTIASIIGRHF